MARGTKRTVTEAAEEVTPSPPVVAEKKRTVKKAKNVAGSDTPAVVVDLTPIADGPSEPVPGLSTGNDEKKTTRRRTRAPEDKTPKEKSERKLNVDLTAQEYVKWLQAKPAEEFASLGGKWLEDYGIAEATDISNVKDDDSRLAACLARVAKANGVNVKGIISASVKKNADGTSRRAVSLPDGDEAVYVGAAMRIQGRAASSWALPTVLRVYQTNK
jgi:hypothetical protein